MRFPGTAQLRSHGFELFWESWELLSDPVKAVLVLFVSDDEELHTSSMGS